MEQNNSNMWGEKPYYSLDYYCKQTYGEKLYKIAINAGLTCPNRDGTLDTRGCIFCSAGGSGEFATHCHGGMKEQIEAGRQLFHEKKTGTSFIAYFQAFTNTYGQLSYLEKIYREALLEECIAGISIATRPDCLSPEVLSLFERLMVEFQGKFIWVELGLQTIHEKTAQFIRRGYSLLVFEQALVKLHELHIPVIVHVIIGLPGESEQMLLQTIHYLNQCSVFGIKLQLLHVLRGTDLATLYENNELHILSETEYLNLLIDCIRHLSPDTVIHRLTGDGPKELLLAPLWSQNKRHVLNTLHKQLKVEHIYQGMDLSKKRSSIIPKA